MRAAICPSSPEETADNIVGVSDRNGLIRYLSQRHAPVSGLGRGDSVRFSTACVAKRCIHWKTGECEWPDLIVQKLPAVDLDRTSTCNIRNECRWFAQLGDEVCSRCPAILGS